MTASRGRILVVEDSPMQRELVAGLLRDEGYDVLEAEDGQQGLDRACHELPEVIFSDIQMPVMDGIVMCRALKENPDTCAIPLVFLSTLDSLEDVVRGLEAGACDYLSKSVDGDQQVLAMAETHMANHRAGVRAPASAALALPQPLQVPVLYFEKSEIGFLVADLRRQPLYVNAAALRAVGGAADGLDAERFDRFLGTVAAGFYRVPGQFFAPVEWEGRALMVRLEAAHNERDEICAVLMLIGAPPQ